MANAHTDRNLMKDIFGIAISNQQSEDRIKSFMTVADDWFENGASSIPVTVTSITKMIASQYAAGLWELNNSGDKTKTPANITLAIKAREEFRSHSSPSNQAVVSNAGPWVYGSLGK